METSDSECFESADEDFVSDFEDERGQASTLHHKLIEPELCKLKIQERDDIKERNDDEKLPAEPISPKLAEPKLQADENLWDEDELDWGSEAAKEQPLKLNESVQSTPESKNQDSGWDDFDVDWESEPSLSNQSKPATVSSTEKSYSNAEDDGWESVEAPKDTSNEKQDSDASWNLFGRWGISSMLNSASAGVSTIRTNLSTALEGSIGIPADEDLAKAKVLETSNQAASEYCEEPSSGFGFSNLVSGVTKFVESTGTKVITGGLDTLEAIGKKTVEVLQDGDPGLKKKRAFLKLDTMGKPNLSQTLREAKEQAEKEMADISQKDKEKRRNKNYETLFDDHQGLVHLEALEMLSKLCSIKLDNLNNSLSGSALKDMQETLEQVKELCELPEDEEDDKVPSHETQESLSTAVKEINIPLSYEKLLAVHEEADVWMQTADADLEDVHQRAIDTLAQITALAVEQYHKAGELKVKVKDHRSTADEADSLVQITTVVKSIIRSQAEKFTDRLNSIGNSSKDEINAHITNIFYEAGNSGTYIQDAFQLLIPVLQVGAV
uniref:Protein FAM114A2 n=1 Tax=Dendroctonus ponderosae TaxID=77166 RepID=A0AAR5P5B3_DENPD